MAGEFDLIDRCFRRARDARAPGVVLGIGDDAALLAPTPGCEVVACADTLVEGVHFPADTPAADIGWKSLAVNLSDIAAMGGVARTALLALTLPRADEDWATAFARGFFELADAHGVALAGGDTTGGPRVITVTVLGEVPAGEALRRDGARDGDFICISGTPGDAALDLARWQAGSRDARDPAIARLLRPEPRLALGVALRGVATACIDVSDGLLADLGHVLRASSARAGATLGALIYLAALPRSPSMAVLTEEEAREHALAGGDDYELCFTVPPGELLALQLAAAEGGLPVAVIGRVTAGGTIRCLLPDGAAWSPRRRGWEHFRDPAA